MLRSVVAGSAETLPRRQRLRTLSDADGLREVVGAAQGNDERWNLLQRQSAEMAMDGAIAAEDQRRVGLVGGIEFVAGKQVDARHLEGPDVMRFGVRSEQGDGAHRATFAQRRRKSKCVEIG